MFGTIRLAINRMVDSLEAESRAAAPSRNSCTSRTRWPPWANCWRASPTRSRPRWPYSRPGSRSGSGTWIVSPRKPVSRQPLTEDSMEMVLHEIDRLSDLLRKLLYFSRPIRGRHDGAAGGRRPDPAHRPLHQAPAPRETRSTSTWTCRRRMRRDSRGTRRPAPGLPQHPDQLRSGWSTRAAGSP